MKQKLRLFLFFICIVAFICFFILQAVELAVSRFGPLIKEIREHKTQIIFLDIGQGDATFITFQNKQQMLIDCAKDSRILEALSRAMPFYDRSIDFLVITHPDIDHYGGCIDVMQRYEIGTLVYTGATKENQFFDEFIEEMNKEQTNGTRYAQIDKQQIWHIASSTVHFLFPDMPVETLAAQKIKLEGNNSSIVMKLSQGEQDILLTGDAEKELETYLIKTYGPLLDVEVLKIGHHGSDTSTIDPFLKATSPHTAIISSGKENTYGHPSPRVLERLHSANTSIWRTDTQGDIIISITEQSIDVKNRATN